MKQKGQSALEKERKRLIKQRIPFRERLEHGKIVLEIGLADFQCTVFYNEDGSPAKGLNN